MAKTFKLDVVTPNANLYSGDCDMVIVRTTEGDIGIMHDHEHTLAPLSVGAIKIKDGNDYKVAACSGGFVSIEQGKVTVVTDSAEWAGDIDVARAEAAKGRAEERIAKKDEHVSMDRARVALRRAINRIHVSNTYKN